MGLFDRSLVAIDIGSSAIKMLELSGSIAHRQLNKFGVEVLPAGAIEDGVIQKNELVQESISKLASRLGLKGRRAAVSLTGSGVLVKKVSVSVGKDTLLEEQIPFHAEQAFQVDPAGLYYDFVVLPTPSQREQDIEVLLVGARRELVEQFVSCIRGAGLKLGVIESDALSLANAFEQNYGQMEGLVALVNVGASHTQISLLSDGVFVFSRDIPIGGIAYTNKIMDFCKQSFDAAESLKITASLSKNASTSMEVSRAISEVNEQLVHELSGTISYFQRTMNPNKPADLKFVFLSGGASRTVGLDAAIAASLHTPVGPMNPFQNIEVSERKFQADYMAGMTAILGVATGLGMRSMKDKE